MLLCVSEHSAVARRAPLCLVRCPACTRGLKTLKDILFTADDNTYRPNVVTGLCEHCVSMRRDGGLTYGRIVSVVLQAKVLRVGSVRLLVAERVR